jgi:hypothetical protein
MRLRARFLLFVDSVLSSSYGVVKGSSTRTHRRHCRFFLSSFSLQDVQHIQTPRSASCPLFARALY